MRGLFRELKEGGEIGWAKAVREAVWEGSKHQREREGFGSVRKGCDGSGEAIEERSETQTEEEREGRGRLLELVRWCTRKETLERT